jgi:hypothetical protein
VASEATTNVKKKSNDAKDGLVMVLDAGEYYWKGVSISFKGKEDVFGKCPSAGGIDSLLGD